MIDSNTLALNASDSGETRPEARADNRVAVYVKISQRAREILDAAATPPRTRATVIEALLESLAKERDPIKERILSGDSPNTLREHGELLELRSWAEHAFQNKRYVWAAGMYRLLAEHPNGSDGLRNICHYRLSLCLIRLSYDIRQEALGRKLDPDSYKLAIATLDEAITYTNKVKRRLGSYLLFPELVLYYNLASCYSLRAQYLVESKLESKAQQAERLLVAGKDEKQKEEVWKSVGEDWRSKLSKPDVEDVDIDAGKAFHCLGEIFPVLSETSEHQDWSELDLPYERIWLVDSTKTDEDFIFLRSDLQRWQHEFEKWSEKALHGRKPISDAVSALIGKSS